MRKDKIYIEILLLHSSQASLIKFYVPSLGRPISADGLFPNHPFVVARNKSSQLLTPVQLLLSLLIILYLLLLLLLLFELEVCYIYTIPAKSVKNLFQRLYNYISIASWIRHLYTYYHTQPGLMERSIYIDTTYFCTFIIIYN